MKKIPIWLYYFLIVFPWISGFASVFIDIYNNSAELATLDELLYTEVPSWVMPLLIVVVVVALVNTIGLILKKDWARKLYILSIIILPCGYLINLEQWIYMSQLALMFNDFSYIALGMLFMILLVPHLYEPILTPQKR